MDSQDDFQPPTKVRKPVLAATKSKTGKASATGQTRGKKSTTNGVTDKDDDVVATVPKTKPSSMVATSKPLGDRADCQKSDATKLKEVNHSLPPPRRRGRKRKYFTTQKNDPKHDKGVHIHMLAIYVQIVLQYNH